MEKSTSENMATQLLEDKLLQLLRDENQALRKLKDNLKKQYEVLLSQNIHDFLAVLEDQKVLIWEMQQMEELREKELRSLLPGLEKTSLREVISRTSPENRSELIRLKTTFDQLVQEVQELKSGNQRLIAQSLEMVQKQLRFLRAFEQKNYNASGKEEANPISSLNRQV